MLSVPPSDDPQSDRQCSPCAPTRRKHRCRRPSAGRGGDASNRRQRSRHRIGRYDSDLRTSRSWLARRGWKRAWLIDRETHRRRIGRLDRVGEHPWREPIRASCHESSSYCCRRRRMTRKGHPREPIRCFGFRFFSTALHSHTCPSLIFSRRSSVPPSPSDPSAPMTGRTCLPPPLAGLSHLQAAAEPRLRLYSEDCA